MSARKSALPGGGSLAITSLFYGLIPVLVAVTGASDFPFVFMTAFALGSAVSAWGYLAVFHKGIWSDWKLFVPSWDTITEPLTLDQSAMARFPAWNWQVLVSFFGGLNVGFFALAVSFMPDVVAAVLVESQPVFFVLLLQWLFRNDGLYVVPVGKIMLMWAAFMGVCLVVLSVEAKPDGDTGMSVSFWGLLVGVIFIFIAICFAVSNAASVRWSESVIAWRQNREGTPVLTGEALEKTKIGYFILTRCCRQTFSFLIGLVFTRFSLGSASPAVFILIVLVSAVITTGGSLFNAKGTFRSVGKPQMQAVKYLTPVFGVLFLLAASHADGVHGWMFSIGFGLVLAANLTANLFRWGSGEKNSAVLKPQE